MRKLVKAGSLTIVLLLGIYSCSLPNNITTNKSEIKAIKPEKTNGKMLVGKVVLATEKKEAVKTKTSKVFKVKHSKKESKFKIKTFQIKGNQVDTTGVTVALHNLGDAKTIATGLTTTDGNFFIDLTNINLTTNGIYILEGTKRGGNNVSSVRTYLKWTGTEWNSITGKDIIINENTTALTIISALINFPINDLISKITITQGVANFSDITDTANQKTILKKEVETVSKEVFGLLAGNKDPIALIKYDSSKPNKYYVEQRDNIAELVNTNSCVGCSFVDVDLKNLGVSLKGKNLAYATFIGANLSGADLTNTSLYQATLKDLQIDNTTIISNTDFSNTDLTGSTITGINTSDSNFSNADFSNGNISNCNLSYTDLRGAVFNKTSLTDDNITGADISEVNLEGAILSDKTRSYLPSTTIQNVNLTGQSLIGLIFDGNDLSGSVLKGCNLTNASFKASVMATHYR